MNLKTFPSKIALYALLGCCVFTVNLSAQKISAEKTGVVAAGYLRPLQADTKPAADRTIDDTKESKPAKPTTERLSELEKSAFLLINQKRAEKGLPPIAWSDEVARIAREHSENMVKFKFFSHRGTDGKMVDGRADAIGLTRWTLIGENIAYNRGYQNPIEAAVEKWMLSPTHRENLLNDRWRESAIGIAVTDDGTYYFTQVFLKRK